MAGAEYDVGVIGAGPYGLALAAHLRAGGMGVQVFGRPMSSWLERMPRGMFLKSEGFASSIADPERRHTLARYCAELGTLYGDCGVPVPIETFTGYGLWFQQTLVPDVVEAEVEHACALGDGFELSLAGGGRFVVRKLVVACGFPSFRYIPPELRGLPAGLVSHSSDHAGLGGFAGRSVVVVGAGQSALETAALLREQGATVSVVVRRPELVWNDPPEAGHRSLRRRARAPLTGLGAGWASVVYAELPSAFFRFPAETRVRLAREVLGPSGAWWLRSRFEEDVRTILGHVVVGADGEDGRVRLRLDAAGEGCEVVADHAVAATGYRVRLDAVPFLDSGLRSRLRTVAGAPALSSSFESSVPGMYFVGLAAANSFGPVMRFVCGTGFAARRVSRALVGATRRSGRRARFSVRARAVEVQQAE
jgi:cation diffusion facilitator CzcD-associated flavoprotein CzcO